MVYLLIVCEMVFYEIIGWEILVRIVFFIFSFIIELIESLKIYINVSFLDYFFLIGLG